MSGLELEEFVEMKNKIEEEMNQKNLRNRKRKNKSFKEDRFDNENMLLITLIWMKYYPKNTLMTFFLNITEYHLDLILRKTLKTLRKILAPLIKWPTDIEFLEYLGKFKDFVFDETEGVVCVIDRTEIEVPSPQDKKGRKILWFRKKFFSINFQIITLLNGEIIYVSIVKKSVRIKVIGIVSN